MKCPKCGLEITDDSIFCSDCGTNIQEYIKKLEDNKFITCSKCGKKIEKETKFCRFCGESTKQKTIEQEYNKIISESQKEIGNNNCPEKFTTNVTLLPIVIIIVLTIGSIATFVVINKESVVVSNNNTINSYTPPEHATIEVINDRIINMGYGYYKVEGIVKNTSDVYCDNPNVEIWGYDSAGNRVSEMPVIIRNGLSSGETYKFSIPIRGNHYKVHTCSCGY